MNILKYFPTFDIPTFDTLFVNYPWFSVYGENFCCGLSAAIILASIYGTFLTHFMPCNCRWQLYTVNQLWKILIAIVIFVSAWKPRVRSVTFVFHPLMLFFTPFCLHSAEYASLYFSTPRSHLLLACGQKTFGCWKFLHCQTRRKIYMVIFWYVMLKRIYAEENYEIVFAPFTKISYI